MPEALKNPVAIFDSKTKKGRLVSILKMPQGSSKTFVAIEVDGSGKVNSEWIVSNAVTSAYEKNSAFSLLNDAIKSELNGKGGVYYINKKEASKISALTGVQFPGITNIPDDFIRSIHDSLSNVNSKYKDITETPQFKRWFGDWQKHPERINPALLNEDGTPKVFYHQTENDFTIFDIGREGEILCTQLM